MRDIKDLNGYEWGKEYPTNGERPNLPDDVWVFARSIGNNYNGYTVGDLVGIWDRLEFFRITDSRYKPVDVPSTSDWFNLGEMPTVGTEIEVYIEQRNSWAKVKVMAVDGEYIVWRNGSDNKSYIGTHKDNIRPIDRHKEKVIEAVKIAAGADLLSTSNHILLDCLYDAGMLVLPTK